MKTFIYHAEHGKKLIDMIDAQDYFQNGWVDTPAKIEKKEEIKAEEIKKEIKNEDEKEVKKYKQKKEVNNG